ncbi:MAG: sugar ABC transporter permease, partial [Candidatus Atribacteria bacterium]|nr:sugar ABC transporter permease [Candidatus Atribacteria bacterium]
MTKKQFIILFLSPAVIIGLLLSVFPLIEAVNLSLRDQTLQSPNSSFVGLENYIKLFSDRRFWNSLKVSFYWEIITVVGTLLLGIAVALTLYGNVGRVVKNVLTLFFVLP